VGVDTDPVSKTAGRQYGHPEAGCVEEDEQNNIVWFEGMGHEVPDADDASFRMASEAKAK